MVVGGVGGVEREDDLAAAVVDQVPGHLGAEQGAVRRQVVDHHAARRQLVEDVQDLAMEQRVAAARQAHGAQPARHQLVEQVGDALERQLLPGAHVLLVAEVAGDVAAVGEVELDVQRAARHGIVADRGDELPLPLSVDQRPTMRCGHRADCNSRSKARGRGRGLRARNRRAFPSSRVGEGRTAARERGRLCQEESPGCVAGLDAGAWWRSWDWRGPSPICATWPTRSVSPHAGSRRRQPRSASKPGSACAAIAAARCWPPVTAIDWGSIASRVGAPARRGRRTGRWFSPDRSPAGPTSRNGRCPSAGGSTWRGSQAPPRRRSLLRWRRSPRSWPWMAPTSPRAGSRAGPTPSRWVTTPGRSGCWALGPPPLRGRSTRARVPRTAPGRRCRPTEREGRGDGAAPGGACRRWPPPAARPLTSHPWRPRAWRALTPSGRCEPRAPGASRRAAGRSWARGSCWRWRWSGWASCSGEIRPRRRLPLCRQGWKNDHPARHVGAPVAPQAAHAVRSLLPCGRHPDGPRPAAAELRRPGPAAAGAAGAARGPGRRLALPARQLAPPAEAHGTRRARPWPLRIALLRGRDGPFTRTAVIFDRYRRPPAGAGGAQASAGAGPGRISRRWEE